MRREESAVKGIRCRSLVIGAVSAALALGGCASSGTSPGAAAGSRDRNLITNAELQGMDALNVYEAVRRLRPTWLRYRGQSVLSGPDRESLRVYVNGSYFGDAESLSNLRARNVQELRFLDARQATLRYGTDHTVGAIVVTTGGG